MWLFLLIPKVQGQAEVVPQEILSGNRIQWQKSSCPDPKECAWFWVSRHSIIQLLLWAHGALSPQA